MQLLALSFLCFFVHETKTITPTKDDLVKKTNEYMEHYEARSQLNADEICTLYATYSQVDPTKAVKILGKLLDWHLKHSPTGNNFLKFLALCDDQILQKYVSKMAKYNILKKLKKAVPMNSLVFLEMENQLYNHVIIREYDDCIVNFLQKPALHSL